MALNIDFINKIPKILLHEHLDGAVRAGTIIDIAKQNNIDLPAYETVALSKWFIEQSNQKDLHKCLAAFAVSSSVMQDKNSIRRVAYEFIEDMYLDGIIYAEVRFCPFILTKNGLTMDEVIISVLDGLNQGKLKYGVEYGLLVCGIRNFAAEINFELVKLTHKYINDGVVGYDFAGAELNYPLSKSVDTIRYLNDNGIPFTAHAGEEAPCAYILEAINLGAKRLGHCAKIFDRLQASTAEICQSLEGIRKNNIHIEINISSNIATGAGDISSHPFISLFNHGISVALNTDDRLMFGNTLSYEYDYVCNMYNLSFADIKQMNINAANSSFASQETKNKILNKLMQFNV
ncbi:MAG: add [Burkholderiales bacterium]|jgi:adenosine deaminase|nr:add [Burkholderiales bacterium]